MSTTDLYAFFIVFGLIFVFLLFGLYHDITKPRMTHLVSVEWYGYMSNNPTYGILVEVRTRRLFKPEIIEAKSVVVMSMMFQALRDVATSERIPYWMSAQVCRQVQMQSVLKLGERDVRRRVALIRGDSE